MPTPARASSSTENSGVTPNSVMLARIGTRTASANRRYTASSVRLRKDHVRAGLDAGHGAVDRALDPLHRKSVGARHDDEVRIDPRVDGGLDAVDHLRFRDDRLARPVPA